MIYDDQRWNYIFSIPKLVDWHQHVGCCPAVFQGRFLSLPISKHFHPPISYSTMTQKYMSRLKFHTYVSATAFVVSILYFSIFLIVPPNDWTCIRAFTTYSPAEDAIHYESIHFGDQFYPPSIYRGLSTPERDEAWNRLMSRTFPALFPFPFFSHLPWLNNNRSNDRHSRRQIGLAESIEYSNLEAFERWSYSCGVGHALSNELLSGCMLQFILTWFDSDWFALYKRIFYAYMRI